jgi:hypothetical protein
MVLVYFLACSMNIRQITAAAGFAPSLKFVDTHANPDTQRDTLAPDIAVYPIADQSQGDAKTEWTFLLNSNSRTHLTRSATHRILCKQKQATFVLRVIRSMLALFVANWPPMLLLTRGVSFAFTFSVCLYAKNTRGLFVGIAMVRLLPGASTISRSPVFFLASFGVTNV